MEAEEDDQPQLSESRESPPLQLAEGEGGDVVVKEVEKELVNDVAAAESRLGEEGGSSDELRPPEGKVVASTAAGKIGGEDLVCRQECREVETTASELAAESRRGEEEVGNVELRPPEGAPSMARKSRDEDLIGGEETESAEQTLEAGQQLVVTGERGDKKFSEIEENKDVVNSRNSPTPLEHATARANKEDDDVVVGGDLSQVVEPKMEITTGELIPDDDNVVDVVEEMEKPDVVEDAEIAEEKDVIDGDSSPALEPEVDATTEGILVENKASDLVPETDLVEKIGAHEEVEKAEEKEVPYTEKNEEKEVEKVEEKNEEKEVSGVAVERGVVDVAEKLESEEASMAGGMEVVEGTHVVVEEVQLEVGENAVGIGKEEMARAEDADMEMADVVQAIHNVEKTEENGIAEDTEMANAAEESGKVQESATEVAEVAEEMEKNEVEEPEMMEESEMDDLAAETHAAVEETVVAEATEVEEVNKSAGGKRKRGKISKAPVRAPVKKKTEEDVCFICFDGGDLVLCDRR